MSHPPSTSNAPDGLALKASLLIATFLLLLTASVVYLLYARGVFEETQTLVLLAEDTEGVLVGMDLTFSGFPIGRVRRIELGDNGAGRIVIEVPRKDAKWLRTSSVFTLTRGLVGGTNLRAFSGIPEDPPLPDGAERKALMGDATAEIPRLVANARELIGNLAQFTAARGPLAASLDNLQAFSAKLAGPGGAVQALLGSDAAEKKLLATLDRASALLARTEKLVANADARVFGTEGLAAKADAQVFGAQGLLSEARAAVTELKLGLVEARESIGRIDALLADAQAVAANAREASVDLGALRAEVDANLRKLGRMIDEINRRWPFAGDAEIRLP